MTKEQQEIYIQTVKRLARMGIKDPTAQIVALAEEIDRYRDKIRRLEERQTETPPPKLRYTHYDDDLERYVVPCLYKRNGEQITFKFMTKGEERTQNGRIITTPALTLAFGEVIDKLAALENREEEQNHAT